MNVLRIWGEGHIPPRQFYDECDKRGIFIWQDFMFGYNMHPSGELEFDKNCRAEIESMIRMLRNHPCILLWAGGWVKAASIGFAPITWEENDEGGWTFTEWELLEWSLVPVPANQEALRRMVKAFEPVKEPDVVTTDKLIKLVEPSSADTVFAPVIGPVWNYLDWDIPAEDVQARIDELKRGRVISAANEKRLQRAYALIGEVLEQVAEQEEEDEKEPETVEDKGVSGKTTFPLGDRERAWDSSAADGRVRTWAGAEEEPNAKYASAHFWFDSDERENFTAYKLLFVDVVDGEARAIPRALFAVAGVLQGARGGVDIPEGDIEGVKSKVETYYARMREAFDDDSIVVPWIGEEAAEPKSETPEQAEDAITVHNIEDAPVDDNKPEKGAVSELDVYIPVFEEMEKLFDALNEEVSQWSKE